mgnify:FL=1
MNLTNYHSHCSFCDGKAPMEDFVKSAIAAGFTSYGISSHAPLPFETCWTLSQERVPNYLQEIGRLKQRYAGEIEIYAGLEIDYLNEESHPAIPRFQELPLDYRIGSVHMLYSPQGKVVDIDTPADLVYTDEEEIIDTDTDPENFRYLLEKHFRGNLQEMVTRYFVAAMRMVEAGGFDFVGHADKISYNAGICQPDLFRQGWFTDMLKEYFTLIAERGIMMEINTKAFLRKGCFFPDIRHFAFIRALGIPVLVNSDAHRPDLINAGRAEALQALKEAGFHTVRQLQGGKWIDVPIA